MLQELQEIINNHGLFIILFFSGVLFGVVSQRIVDNKPVKPIFKRIAIAGMTMSIALSLNKFIGHLEAKILYPISPVLGFFGEAIVETINQKRYGISTGFLELLLEKFGFVKKRGDKNENASPGFFKFSYDTKVKKSSKKRKFINDKNRIKK